MAQSINPGVGADKKNPLTWNQWVLAYPRYALAASACGMLPYAAAMGHMVHSGQVVRVPCRILLSSGSLSESGRDCCCRGPPALAGHPLRRGRSVAQPLQFTCLPSCRSAVKIGQRGPTQERLPTSLQSPPAFAKRSSSLPRLPTTSKSRWGRCAIVCCFFLSLPRPGEQGKSPTAASQATAGRQTTAAERSKASLWFLRQAGTHCTELLQEPKLHR